MKQAWSVLFALAALSGVCSTVSAASPTYRVTSVAPGYPTDDFSLTLPVAINNAGQVIVHYMPMGSHVGGYLLCTDTGCNSLGTDDRVQASALNDAGQTAGSLQAGVSWATLAGQPIGIDRAHCPSCGVFRDSEATSLNENGRATGRAAFPGFAGQQAFKYTPTRGMFSLGTLGGTNSWGISINRHGHVAGSSNLAGDAHSHAFLYTEGAMRDLGTLGGDESRATALNGRNQVVGCSTLADNITQAAFQFDGQTMHALPSLGGTSSCAKAINLQNIAVGFSAYPNAGNARAVVYRQGKVHDLKLLLDPVTGEGWDLMDASGINDKGQIIGTGIRNHDGVWRTFLLTPIAP
jgi:probable HAF family extracellular repeat protein